MSMSMPHVLTIEDPDDTRVAEYRHMNDQAMRRRMEGDHFFLSEGWLSIEHLIATGHRFRSVLLSPSRVNRFAPFLERPELQGVQVFVAANDVMRDIVGFDMPRAVVMSMDRQPLVSLSELLVSTERLVVLEGLNDDANVGAIARAARAFGVGALVLSPTTADPYYRRTVRVSMGEILYMQIARIERQDWPSALTKMHDAGFETWAMTPDSRAATIWTTEVPRRLAMLFGAEGPGLTEEATTLAGMQVRIPISDEVDSLNVGHAAAITLAAVARS